jgi:polyhydroxyalkanoate synthesis regulator phasin
VRLDAEGSPTRMVAEHGSYRNTAGSRFHREAENHMERGTGTMDVFRKAFLAGMGAISLTSEHAHKLVSELVKAGELREKEGRSLLEEMVKKAGDVKKELESAIARQMDATHKRLRLVSLDQMKKMESRVEELEKRLPQAPRLARSTRAAVPSGRRTARKAAGK